MESLFNKVVGLERLFHRTLLKLVFFQMLMLKKLLTLLLPEDFF